MWQRVLWLSLGFVLSACGENVSPRQLDEPCTRTAQCEAGLTCLAGVCRMTDDAGVDGGEDGGS
jgi:hypothetical protein